MHHRACDQVHKQTSAKKSFCSITWIYEILINLDTSPTQVTIGNYNIDEAYISRWHFNTQLCIFCIALKQTVLRSIGCLCK